MNLPHRKFEVGEKVVDTFKNKVCTITDYYIDQEDSEPKWCYSFDPIGWYFVPESDLAKYEGE